MITGSGTHGALEQSCYLLSTQQGINNPGDFWRASRTIFLYECWTSQLGVISVGPAITSSLE